MEADANRLLEKARAGENSAAGQLVDLFYERIYAFLRRLSNNEADAADLTQKTFSRIWQALPGFAGRSTVSSWMHGIAYHVYVDWVRRERRSEARSDNWWLCQVDHHLRPDESLVRDDIAATVYASVDEMEPDLRDTIHLHYYQGLTIQETAAATGVATSTVKYRQRQALDLLQKKFAAERSFP
jgi:RNA polymerase sigma-70 factor (ECF subfamily)